MPNLTRVQVFALLQKGATLGYGSMRPEEIARDLVARYKELRGVDPRDLTVRIVAWKRGERADDVERAIADAAWRVDCLTQRMDACENEKRADAKFAVKWGDKFHVSSGTGVHASGRLSQLKAKGVYVDLELGEEAVRRGSINLPAHMHEKQFENKKLVLKPDAFTATKVHAFHADE